ncbi:MAG: hypothetical protein AAFQ82_25550 [Myxococcota bacterium]
MTRTSSASLAFLVCFGVSSAQAEETALEQPEVETDSLVRTESPSALRQYEKRLLGHRDELHISGVDGNLSSDREWEPYLGIEQLPVGEATFYELAGRPELASEYRRMRFLRNSVALVGGALSVGSLAYGVATRNDDLFDEGLENDVQRSLTGISAAIGTALITGVIYYLIDPHPLDVFERGQLAIDHNERLQAELGLTDEAVRLTRNR